MDGMVLEGFIYIFALGTIVFGKTLFPDTWGPHWGASDLPKVRPQSDMPVTSRVFIRAPGVQNLGYGLTKTKVSPGHAWQQPDNTYHIDPPCHPLFHGSLGLVD